VTYLARSGYETTVLCADRSDWCDRYDESLLNQIPAAVRIKRITPQLFTDGKIAKAFGTFLQRHALSIDSVGWVGKGAISGLKLAIFGDIDCVITSGPPHICHIIGWIIHAILKRPWIVDYRDLWTDDPAQSPHRGFKLALFKWLETRVIRAADAVVTVSPSWTEHLRRRFRAQKQPDRFVLIRNGFTGDEIQDNDSDMRKLEERIHIHSSGTPQALAVTVTLLDAVAMIKASPVPASQLPLITFTGMTDEYKRQITSRGLSDCVVDVGQMSRHQSLDYSRACDVLLVVVNNDNPSRRGTIPAKTYEAMALGRHILAVVPDGSDVAALVDGYGDATICNVDDPSDIHRGLSRLMDAHKTGCLISTHADAATRRRFLEPYSRAHQARQLISLIEAVSNSLPADARKLGFDDPAEFSDQGRVDAPRDP
jgi:glycosyltransferase involved in cell wall biosynthesis